MRVIACRREAPLFHALVDRSCVKAAFTTVRALPLPERLVPLRARVASAPERAGPGGEGASSHRERRNSVMARLGSCLGRARPVIPGEFPVEDGAWPRGERRNSRAGRACPLPESAHPVGMRGVSSPVRGAPLGRRQPSVPDRCEPSRDGQGPAAERIVSNGRQAGFDRNAVGFDTAKAARDGGERGADTRKIGARGYAKVDGRADRKRDTNAARNPPETARVRCTASSSSI